MKLASTIFVIAVLSVSFLSCSKEKTDPPVPQDNIVKPLAVIRFNGDAIDSMAQLNINGSWGSATYVNDHNGQANGAMFFDGSDKIQYQFAPLKGQAVTMTAWVKLAGASMGSQNFISVMDPVKGGITAFQSGYSLGATVSVPSTNNALGAQLDENWHHFAMTYDGKDIRVYIDGLLSATENHPGTVGDDLRGMTIGGMNSEFWTGYIDDLRIYDKVFTPEAISKLAAL